MVAVTVKVVGQREPVGCRSHPGRGEGRGEGGGEAPTAILGMWRGNARRGGAAGVAHVGIMRSCKKIQGLIK